MGSWTSTLLFTSGGLFAAQKLRRLYRHLRYGKNPQQQQEFLQRYEEVKRKREEIRKDFIAIVAEISPESKAIFEKPENWLNLTERSAEAQIEDFALAEGRNKLLLELTHAGMVNIPGKLPKKVIEKYLIKTALYPVVRESFSFSPTADTYGGGYLFTKVPKGFEWKITSAFQQYQIIFEMKDFCEKRSNYPTVFSDLLQFRKHAPTDFVAKIVPTNESMIPWFVLHLVPCLLHDHLHSSGWSFKYLFGGASYLLSFLFSYIAIVDQRDILIIAAAIFYGIQNLYLPYKYYPSSLHYFNFQGLFAMAYGYIKLMEKYGQLAKLSSKQKTVTNVILLGLFGLSNNWSRFLNVHNNTPELFWGALKANSISAGILFMNYYFYHVGRMFTSNDKESLSVVFNWSGKSLGAVLGLLGFGFLVSIYYPFVIA